ncbi:MULTISPECIES: DUF4031 domain-containing protein [Mycobacteriaceae]|uniref:DUF4031 domain-containing protein n=1 Tax=Mycobacteriaceae TaxID=1762 RepID=UPI0002682662|nr:MULTISPECIES: DUF4031 domain-containing protein [Mycobacteriaceae]EIU51704.1 hypothetical protein MA6G0125S_5440 [Mycobacteroides abscessus 6G-0125-S]EIU64176.1 hypothetical protein MA6G0728S_5293 [Mycobacteroides abscessus 6G-0728-S]EIU74795.1 hypothetical protein MA6G1108_5443 [Mycobacteroides abscessus 6G-1108]EIV03042.1 hypothetical protein MA6G0728R_5322 [Mycobacteroides abscessus 6G-0728-R]
MTVYVDDMRLPAKVNGVFARWSHLMADTDDELHTFAKRLGLKREWAQKPGTWESHYDVTDRLRTAAIRQGAVPIGVFSAETLALMERRMAQCD